MKSVTAAILIKENKILFQKRQLDTSVIQAFVNGNLIRAHAINEVN